MTQFTLHLNDAIHTVEAAPDAPLLYVLRDQLGLSGPRYGCGEEHCGACRVLVDGASVCSCTLPVSEIGSRKLLTPEGLPESNPLQQAFLELNAGQCGYCLSGILMSARALLDVDPAPDRAKVQAALAPHLCRCGAHNRIINAVLRAAELQREAGDRS